MPHPPAGHKDEVGVRLKCWYSYTKVKEF